jgi:hypothetical protein
MGSFSNYLEEDLLDHVVGKTAYTMPTAYATLATADPTDAGTGASHSEVPDSNAYARKSTAGADWNAASAGAIDNANDITFVQATGSWGTVSHFTLCDNGTHGAGNMLLHGALTTSKAIGNGDTAKFAAGDLDITLD